MLAQVTTAFLLPPRVGIWTIQWCPVLPVVREGVLAQRQVEGGYYLFLCCVTWRCCVTVWSLWVVLENRIVTCRMLLKFGIGLGCKGEDSPSDSFFSGTEQTPQWQVSHLESNPFPALRFIAFRLCTSIVNFFIKDCLCWGKIAFLKCISICSGLISGWDTIA